MTDFFINILKSCGVNRAIGFGVLSKFWSMLSGPVTIYLIASRFTKDQQGYYYTFGSVLALQIFFELGLLAVLAQFAAHEFAFLSWGEKGDITGNWAHRDRFLDLMGKGLKWYGVSAILLVSILVPAGFLFFAGSPSAGGGFSWQLPWALAVVGVAGNLLLIPFFALITGSGDVTAMNRREMFGGITGSILGWLVILSGGGLYSLFAVTSGTLVVGLLYLARSKPRLVTAALSHAFGRRTPGSTISWWSEVWPMQWKIALSWASGYFIYQLFTPILFKFHGPAVAGQMGMTLTAVTVVQGVSIMWINARSPEFGKLIASGKWEELDRSFYQVLKQAVAVCVVLSTGAVAVIAGLQTYSSIGSRFLSLPHVVIFLVAVCSNVVTASWATYMRAHKTETMLAVSVINALLVGTSTMVLGMKYSSMGMTVGYCAVTILFVMPATSWIFGNFKKQYRSREPLARGGVLGEGCKDAS